MPTELKTSDIHLWYCPLATLDADVRQSCRALLDESEMKRQERYISAEAADQFLVGRALLRHSLSLYAQVAPANWRFETNDHGKPRVASSYGANGPSFNVTNTRGMVACAVCQGGAIGVDVEGDTQRYDSEVARRFFTSNETAAIESVPPEDRRERFLRTWTLKEAVVKATGLGLVCPLSAFDVQIDANPPQVAFTERMLEDARHWRLFSLRLESSFQAAVAVRSPADQQLRLTVQRWPLEQFLSGRTDAKE